MQSMIRKKVTNKIPFAIVVALMLFSAIRILAFPHVSDSSGEGFQYFFSAPLVYGLVGLTFILVLIFLKKRLWKHAFAILLIVSFTPYVQFYYQTFTIWIGVIPIELIGFALLIPHLILNKDILRDFLSLFKTSEHEAQVSQENRINRFEQKFADKSQKELEQIVEEKMLVPEAVDAARRLLGKK